jgi:quercetin dioxygenase-like cupin family protein
MLLQLIAARTKRAARTGGNPMDIHSGGSRPSRRAPADWFTGTVWQDPILDTPEPARVRASVVRFEPGARTNWHTHPVGQTLYILSGTGRVQHWGGLLQEVSAGDVVWIPPGEKHWHGATPTNFMEHVAIAEILDGKFVDWLEKVTDQQYNTGA